MTELARRWDSARFLSTEPFAPKLTDEGLRHPITQLRFDRRDNLARWAGLPQLEGVNLVAGVKPGATVLLEHPTLRAGDRPMPVLVVGEHGKGRTLALLTDSAWRWGFLASGRDGDDGRAYTRFMENAVRWLFKDPDLEKQVGLLWLGEEFAQLSKEYCNWTTSRPDKPCNEDAINRSAFVSWVDCRL